MNILLKRFSIIILLVLSMISVSFANTGLSWTFDTQGTLNCIPNYKATIWTDCSNSVQERTVIDLNACQVDKVEKRVCAAGNDELQNLMLNSKSVILENIGDKIYTGQVSGTDYDYVFHSDYAIPDTSFIVLNKLEQRSFFGRLIDIDEAEGRYTYLIKDIEENDFDLLIQEGFLVNEAQAAARAEDIQSTYVFSAFGVMILILIVATLILIVVFVVKRNHKHSQEVEEDVSKGIAMEDSTKKTVEPKTPMVGLKDPMTNQVKAIPLKKPEPERVYKQRDLLAVENYAARNRSLSDDEIIRNLMGVGWDEGLVREALKRTSYKDT